MADVMITDGMKQQIITRLATINSATSILNLINGRPAKVTIDEVLMLAERIERWAWRDLLGDQPPTQAPEKPTPHKGEGMTAPPAVTGTETGHSRNPHHKNQTGARNGAERPPINRLTRSSLSAEAKDTSRTLSRTRLARS